MQAHRATATRRLGAELDTFDADDYLGTEGAALAIHRHPETLKRWRRDRKFLQYVLVGGGEVLYKVADLREFLKSARVEPVSGREP